MWSIATNIVYIVAGFMWDWLCGESGIVYLTEEAK